MINASKESILSYLKTIKQSLNNDGIDSIGLFGSYANNTYNNNSDIDILIYASDKFIKKYGAWGYFDKINSIKSNISNYFNKKVDIFDANSSSSLKKYIIKETIYV